MLRELIQLARAAIANECMIGRTILGIIRLRLPVLAWPRKGQYNGTLADPRNSNNRFNYMTFKNVLYISCRIFIAQVYVK